MRVVRAVASRAATNKVATTLLTKEETGKVWKAVDSQFKDCSDQEIEAKNAKARAYYGDHLRTSKDDPEKHNKETRDFVNGVYGTGNGSGSKASK